MIGIYKITNKLNNKSYIGQSLNIENRFKEHLYHKQSPIDFDIHKYGADLFCFEILEECTPEELDYKEDYYIQKFDSIVNGYNIVRGGQHNVGESNANVILTEQDVYDIREAYNNHENKYSVYEKYKDKITKSYFSNVWEGISWKHVHYDVYTEENIDYYKSGTSVGENGHHSVFTNEEVLNLRKRYVNETAKEIYETIKDRCEYQTLQCILWGRRYSNVPVYDKKNKKWINK